MKQPDIRPLFEKQLENCGVDYFDFYFLDEQNQMNYQIFREQEAFETVLALKKEGRIRRIGIVFHDTPELLDYLRVLKEEGFFNAEKPYVLSMEVTLRPGEDEQIVLANTKRVLNRAWALLED